MQFVNKLLCFKPSCILGLFFVFFANFAQAEINWQKINGGKSAKFEHNQVGYYVFSPDKNAKIRLFWKNDKGENYFTFRAVNNQIKSEKKQAVMITNAAIYDTEFRPAGLWIENGKELKEINKNQGKGNFHIKPAAVVYFQNNQATIIPLADYEKRKIRPDYAFQAAPMLLINGKINSRFQAKLYSPYSRNAICTDKENKLYFVITDETKTEQKDLPNFYNFARALQEINCQQAVYLDGSISHMYSENFGGIFHWKNFAGIIAVIVE
ncbi:MAG: phosphodiester glycosidase family protein [Cardiobacteriaceae bacterium]|nr:phosphodiester glycosidase family protein [Cardiobacteriaceae bacterium]